MSKASLWNDGRQGETIIAEMRAQQLASAQLHRSMIQTSTNGKRVGGQSLSGSMGDTQLVGDGSTGAIDSKVRDVLLSASFLFWVRSAGF